MGTPLRVVMLGPGLQVQGGVSTVERLILEHLPSEISVRHLATMEDGSNLYKIGVFARCLPKFLIVLLRRQADIVHIHFSIKGSTVRKMILSWMTFFFRKPLILHAHGAPFDTFYYGQPRWFQKLINAFVKRCDCLIALSESWKEFYVHICGVPQERALVLLNPVQLPLEIPPRAGREAVTFIYLGIMDERKGAFRLVRAFADLPAEQRARARIIMAGDGEVESVRSLVQELGLGEQVTVLNWITPEQRDAFLAQSDVFVLPSLSEGLPMAMLEAMSWGLPVLSTPVGGIPEVVKNGVNGLLVEPGDVPALTDAMRTLIENETMRLSMGQKARQTVEPLDVKQYTKSLAEIYQSVAK